MPGGTATGSTVPRRQLGRYLRDMRNRGTADRSGPPPETLEWSEAKIWRIETGQVAMRSLDVEAMCKVYGAPADVTESPDRTWPRRPSQRAGGRPTAMWSPTTSTCTWVWKEAAGTLSWYESELVPGLLQTENYARTLIMAGNPTMRGSRDRTARSGSSRPASAAHQGHGDRPTVDVVLNESGPAPRGRWSRGHGCQLQRLVDVDQLPNVSVRVVPFSAGLHYGQVSGPFVILQFPLNGDGRESEPPTVYAEGLTGALYLDRPHEIERYSRTFTNIEDSALDQSASRDLIVQAARELRQ